MIRAWMEDLWRRKSTSILTGIGVSGMAGATIWAVAATPKAMKRIANKREELEKNKLNPWETVKEVWDIYVLPAGLEILSAGCIVFAHVKDERRIATLTAAATLSETAYKEYREKVKDILGEKKEKQVQDEIDKDKAQKADLSEAVKPRTIDGQQPILEALTNHLFYGTIESVKRAEIELNRIRLRDDGQITMNEYLNAITLDDIPVGNDLGWYYDPLSQRECDQFRIGFSAQLAGDEKTPIIVIRPLDNPTYDFNQRQW